MKLLSANYTSGAINAGLLVLRVGMGVLMIVAHGYDKIANFDKYTTQFPDFLGLGSKVSLGLDIFAEFFCALLVIVGLFTRLACIPLVFAMLVAVFKAHNGQIFGEGEKAMLFAIGFFTLLITGPGRYSADSMFKR
jgi:putative oxidoreductase